MSRQRQVAENSFPGDAWLRLAASCGYGKSQYGQEERCRAFHGHTTQHGLLRFRKPATIWSQAEHHQTRLNRCTSSPIATRDHPMCGTPGSGCVRREPPGRKPTLQYQETRTWKTMYI